MYKHLPRVLSGFYVFLAVMIASLMAYVGYHYERFFSDPVRGTAIMAALAGCLVFSLDMLRANPKARGLAALYLCTVAFGLWGSEMFLTLRPELSGLFGTKEKIIKDLNQKAEIARKLKIEFDPRTPAQVAMDLRSEGQDAWLLVAFKEKMYWTEGGELRSRFAHEGRELFLPSGIGDVVTVHCNEGGPYIVLKTDRYGFNNPYAVWSNDSIQIVGVGGSDLMGACVSNEEEIFGHIRKRYPRSLNLAYGGIGPLSELASLIEYGSAVEPDVVIWFFSDANDFFDLAEEKLSPLAMRYLEPGFKQGLQDIQPRIDAMLRGYADDRIRDSVRGLNEVLKPRIFQQRVADFLLARHFRHLIGLTASYSEELPENAPENYDKQLVKFLSLDAKQADYALFGAIIKRAKNAVESWGGRFVFVYLPYLSRYCSDVKGVGNLFDIDYCKRADEEEIGNLEEIRKQVIKIVADEGIPVVDVTETFNGLPNRAMLFPALGNHYSSKGYALAAQTVLTKMNNLGYEADNGSTK